MAHLGPRTRRLRAQQDPDAAREASGDVHFLRAQERHIGPAKLPCRLGGKRGAQVRRRREEHLHEVGRVDLVFIDDGGEQLARGRKHFARVVGIDLRRAPKRSQHSCRLRLVTWHRRSVVDERVIRLIAITDDLRDGNDGLAARAAAAVRGGATMVQLRLKHVAPRELVEVARMLVRALPVPVVVNDRLDVALAAGAAGAHLGADDVPVAAARAMAPAGFLIGSSLGEERELVDARDADYVGIGPLFGTLSKADAGQALGAERFSRLAHLGGRPAVAIGGVTAANAREAIRAGACGIAVIRAILASADPEGAARALRDAMGDQLGVGP